MYIGRRYFILGNQRGSLEEAIFKLKLNQCMTYPGRDGEW